MNGSGGVVRGGGGEGVWGGMEAVCKAIGAPTNVCTGRL
jgi:hypothetical protein